MSHHDNFLKKIVFYLNLQNFKNKTTQVSHKNKQKAKKKFKWCCQVRLRLSWCDILLSKRGVSIYFVHKIRYFVLDNNRLVLIYQKPFLLLLLTGSKKMYRCDMLKIRKYSCRLSIFLIACPEGFSMSGSGIQKGCRKDFDKYQYTMSHCDTLYIFEEISPATLLQIELG